MERRAAFFFHLDALGDTAGIDQCHAFEDVHDLNILSVSLPPAKHRICCLDSALAPQGWREWWVQTDKQWTSCITKRKGTGDTKTAPD